jgi:hypothetical protein
MRGLKLTIEPVPVSSWGISLANLLPYKEWAEIRTQIYREADYRCEICKATGTLHAHEVWNFKEKEKIQYLKDIVCLCETCHQVKHFGRSSRVYGQANAKKLIEHWCTINKLPPEMFKTYQEKVYEISKKRAKKFYVVKVGRRILS